jgi:hypothetical protein
LEEEENTTTPTTKTTSPRQDDQDKNFLTNATKLSTNVTLDSPITSMSVLLSSSSFPSQYSMLGTKLENIQEQSSWTNLGDDEWGGDHDLSTSSSWGEDTFLLLPEPTRVDFMNLQQSQQQPQPPANNTTTTFDPSTIATTGTTSDNHDDDDDDNANSTMDLILFLKDVDLSSHSPWETNTTSANSMTKL